MKSKSLLMPNPCIYVSSISTKLVCKTVPGCRSDAAVQQWSEGRQGHTSQVGMVDKVMYDRMDMISDRMESCWVFYFLP